MLERFRKSESTIPRELVFAKPFKYIVVTNELDAPRTTCALGGL